MVRVQATLRADGRWVEGELVPMRLVGDGTPVRDDAETAHGLVRRLSQQDFGARATRVGFVRQLEALPLRATVGMR